MSIAASSRHGIAAPLRGMEQLTAAHDCDLWPGDKKETKRSEEEVVADKPDDEWGEGVAASFSQRVDGAKCPCAPSRMGELRVELHP